MSPLIEQLKIALKLADYDERLFISYLIKMAIDEAYKLQKHERAA